MEILKALQNKDAALLLVRIIVGSTFIAHGSQKVFGAFSGPGLVGFAQWIGTLGLPSWLGYVSAFGELLGGLMVLTGFMAELGAFVLVINMAVAIGLVHWKHGYFVQNNGYEYPLNLLLLCIAIIIGGAGVYSAY